jgi:hypothetical protein
LENSAISGVRTRNVPFTSTSVPGAVVAILPAPLVWSDAIMAISLPTRLRQ